MSLKDCAARDSTALAGPDSSMRKKRRLLAGACLALLTTAAHAQTKPPPPQTRPAIESYAELAWHDYRAAYEDALRLQRAVDEFVQAPLIDEKALARVRKAWIESRPSYGHTEAFRFYEGPIDFGKRADGTKGPEPLLNSWPVDEAYIDYVRGNPTAGLINDPSVPINRATLIERNARDDEIDVTTGFHAIEFLLWGQDLNADGPGNRPASDFAGGGAAARRREYLKVTTDLLVENLKFVVDQWAPGADNYRARFLRMDARESVADILTGMATLAGFEVAAERLATPLDSGSQEDEHSCFSDTTDIDILANVTGIADLYFGRGANFQGTGIDYAVAAVNPEVNARIVEQLTTSLKLAHALDHPFDQTLATPPGSAQRARVEALVSALQSLARLLKVAGRTLAVNIVVTIEVED
jgi:putative iron-regulated protein